MKRIFTSCNDNYRYPKDQAGAIVYNIDGLWNKKIENYSYEKTYPALEPKYRFWKEWEQNVGNLSEEENDKRYVEQYYKQVLSKLDPEQLYNELVVQEEDEDAEVILICDDDITRHIVSAWFKLLLGLDVHDGYFIHILGAHEMDGCWEYIGLYKSKIKGYLKEIIEKDLKMKGYHSLKALYLVKKAKELEQKAFELGKGSEEYNFYMQYAYYVYSHADVVEAEYNEEMKSRR